MRRSLAGWAPRSRAARVEIDAARKTVAIGVGDTSDPIPVMRSAFREGIGCVVMSPDQTFARHRHAAAPRNAARCLAMPPSMPWPEGDRIDKKALPKDIDESALKRAGDWAFDRVTHGGHRGQVTLSLLVIHDGDIVYERYAPGVDMHTRTRTWSTAKSITSTLVGIAIRKGLLKLDEPLPFAWLPEVRGNAPDPRRKITLRHVLHMSSGLYPVDNDLGPSLARRSRTGRERTPRMARATAV